MFTSRLQRSEEQLMGGLLPFRRLCHLKTSSMGLMYNLIPIPQSESLSKVAERAANFLAEGNIVAVPTDTIYGLAGLAQNDGAVSSLYRIKGRDPRKPVAICVDEIEAISQWAKVDDIPSDLLQALLPGPVTVVLQRTRHLNPNLNPENDKVGVRIPKYPFIRAVVKLIGEPLALTSANLSNQPSCLNVEEFKNIWPEVGAVFDGGALGNSGNHRLGSTVVDLTIPGTYSILRPGMALDNTEHVLRSFGITSRDLKNHL